MGRVQREVPLLHPKKDVKLKLRIYELYILDVNISKNMYIYIYIPGTCLSSTIQKKAFSHQTKGHLGSRYIYIYFFLF